MRNQSTGLLSIITAILIPTVSMAITTYETVDATDLMAGGWDINIFADDVHFHHGGIITNIEMHLAIRGNQQCKLWIFDDLGKDPIYTTAFTNIPSGWAQFKTYQFPLHLDVPKDIYVGFSAQGDGWNGERVDFSDNATNVTSGLITTPGSYWWGSISGGQLVDGGVYTSYDHFRMKVDMIPPMITDYSFAADSYTIGVSNLSTFAAHSIERSQNLASNTWNKTVTIYPGPSSATCSGSRTDYSGSAFYRIRVEHDNEL